MRVPQPARRFLAAASCSLPLKERRVGNHLIDDGFGFRSHRHRRLEGRPKLSFERRRNESRARKFYLVYTPFFPVRQRNEDFRQHVFFVIDMDIATDLLLL